MILNLNVHFTRVSDLVGRDDLLFDPPVPVSGYRDSFGNWCTRIVAPAGRLRISADATVRDSGLPDAIVPGAQQHPVPELPEEALLFLLGSRYCETDKLSETAWNLFGQAPVGWGRVQAICDYVHRHITFGYQHARMTRSALESYYDRTGVCRDYTHLAVAFCRCMSLGTILLILLILVLVGVIPAWPHARSWGYAPSGIVGVVLLIVLVLFLMGRL